jgi:hypothetical protein
MAEFSDVIFKVKECTIFSPEKFPAAPPAQGKSSFGRMPRRINDFT